MIIRPKYTRYILRVWAQIYIILALISITIAFVTLVNYYNILPLIFFVLLPLLGVLILRSLIQNKLYLESIEINKKNQFLKLTIYRYNKKYKEYKVQINDSDVKITKDVLTLTSFYKIEFFHKEKIIYQQKECKSWSREKLFNITNEIKKLKASQY